MSSALKPVQSMKKSPVTLRPSASVRLLDEAVGAPLHLDHLALGALEPALLGIFAQVLGHQQRVDVQRVVGAADGRVARLGRVEEPPLLGHDIAGREILQVRGVALRTRLQPALVEVVIADGLADDAERVEVRIAALMPADELDAQLVGAVDGADEFVLVDAETLDETHEGRHRRLTDTDGAEFVGLDELDLAELALQVLAQHRRRQPPGGAAADDHELLDVPHHQFRFSTITPGASWDLAVL